MVDYNRGHQRCNLLGGNAVQSGGSIELKGKAVAQYPLILYFEGQQVSVAQECWESASSNRRRHHACFLLLVCLLIVCSFYVRRSLMDGESEQSILLSHSLSLSMELGEKRTCVQRDTAIEELTLAV